MSKPKYSSVKKPVKLVIWDLDETFWKGTLSEEGIEHIQGHIDMIRTLVDRGIMCSICSKNDYDAARKAVEASGVWHSSSFHTFNGLRRVRRSHR